MNNIVDFGTGRARPRPSIQTEHDGARILFFTGVRYERQSDDELPSFVPEAQRFYDNLDLADAESLPTLSRHAPV